MAGRVEYTELSLYGNAADVWTFRPIIAVLTKIRNLSNVEKENNYFDVKSLPIWKQLFVIKKNKEVHLLLYFHDVSIRL